MGQFFLAISLKDNISLGEVLVATAELVEEPYPKPEAPGLDENGANIASRTPLNAAANRRIDEYNEERRRKGPHIGPNWYYHEAEARLKSKRFFSLGNVEIKVHGFLSPSGPKYMLLHRFPQML